MIMHQNASHAQFLLSKEGCHLNICLVKFHFLILSMLCLDQISLDFVGNLI